MDGWKSKIITDERLDDALHRILGLKASFYYQYKKVNEIAQELQVNPQTVKTRLRRGREVLKRFLIKEGYGSNAD